MIERVISNLRSWTEKVPVFNAAVKTPEKDTVQFRPIPPKIEKEYLRGKNPDLTF